MMLNFCPTVYDNSVATLLSLQFFHFSSLKIESTYSLKLLVIVDPQFSESVSFYDIIRNVISCCITVMAFMSGLSISGWKTVVLY